jgi:hypothetical protein
MSQLEEHEQLIGSALLLESSLVHARGIVSADVRMISEYLVASPLGLAKVCFTLGFRSSRSEFVSRTGALNTGLPQSKVATLDFAADQVQCGARCFD